MSSVYSDPEMHNKICKKMAQLTRVIYQMNTKNDENDLRTRKRVQAYEDELSAVVRDCNTIISKYKSDMERNDKQEELKKQLRRLEDKMVKEKDLAKKEFLTLKNRFDERERRASADYEVRSHPLSPPARDN